MLLLYKDWTMERQAFDRQPGRAVLIDLQSPMDSGTCINIKEGLSSVLTILSHLAGPSRVPLFSLFVIRSYTECIYPLQPIRGNYARVQVALEELASVARDLGTQNGNVRTSLLDGVQEAMAQFNRHAQSLKQKVLPSPGCPSQLEVTIITAQTPSSMKGYIERIANHIDLQHLKKIVVICVNDPDKLVEQVDKDDVISSSSSLSQPLSQMSSPSELGLSVLDLRTCDNDLYSLQMALRVWLQDCSTDNEHLHITLPSPSSSALVSCSQPLVIKCDLHDRMLHPSMVPSLTKHFLLGAGSSNIAGPLSGPGISSSQNLIPIYKFDAVGFVRCDGICESVLYGLPLVVKPTVCWKLDWEELERNQQYFQALCLTMKTKDQAMVLCTSSSSRFDAKSFLPKAHYLLLPSPSPASLLLKSVVVNELLLPVDYGESNDDQLEQPAPEVQDTLKDSLEKLCLIDCYNPLSMHSNLCEAISHFSGKRTPTASVQSVSTSRTGSGAVNSGRGSRGAVGSERGRGRGGTRYGSMENGSSVKRKQPPQNDSNRGRGGHSARPKRLHILRDGFLYGNDHVAN